MILRHFAGGKTKIVIKIFFVPKNDYVPNVPETNCLIYLLNRPTIPN